MAIPVIGCSGGDLGRGVLLVKIWAEDFADFFRNYRNCSEDFDEKKVTDHHENFSGSLISSLAGLNDL